MRSCNGHGAGAGAGVAIVMCAGGGASHEPPGQSVCGTGLAAAGVVEGKGVGVAALEAGNCGTVGCDAEAGLPVCAGLAEGANAKETNMAAIAKSFNIMAQM